MRILVASLQSLVFLLVFFIGISSASRTKRQITFENDSPDALSNEVCETPDRKPGNCIRLTSCRALTQSVSRDRLRHYFCGFEGDEPRVCCPLVREEVTTTVRTSTTPPIEGTIGRFEEEARNSGGVTRKPTPDSVTMPHFLPQNCGRAPIVVPSTAGSAERKIAATGGWPWMAVVFVRRGNGVLEPYCGGVLVTNQHVVTAAQCVVTGRSAVPVDASRFVVRLAAYDLSDPNEPGAVDVDVESTHPHEQFQSTTYQNDIAVLKLREPVPLSVEISPICLPYDSLREGNLTDTEVIVLGYGRTIASDSINERLMESNLFIKSQDLCKRAYEPAVQITNVYMCAGTRDGSDTCLGDSGSPLMAVGRNNRYYLVGIVSFGRQCGIPNAPGVYTRVTEFLDWLTRNLSD